ncbi:MULTISPECIES: hypothetical protein [Streptomyces]|uniref:hypothetical protein n=1 Tax=Streptomyces TaxID=1883 RepID=UPI001E30B86E|nr:MULTISPECIES: hypothetical protein [Streptomyces]UFQ16446.1 hypothetical protein J2N69_16335 [Streptomyces huasconensis]WCL86048.1 hypothetical protein PPN52_16345 [Streptomyces sp. JCM 35825]
MVDQFGRVLCNGCKMDLHAYPSDYDDGGKEVYCGHCENERHECPEEVAARLLRDAVKRIRQHEAEWLATLREEVPSYDPADNLADDGPETDRMDEVQTDQAFDAQLLLRDLLKEFEGVAA